MARVLTEGAVPYMVPTAPWDTDTKPGETRRQGVEPGATEPGIGPGAGPGTEPGTGPGAAIEIGVHIRAVECNFLSTSCRSG